LLKITKQISCAYEIDTTPDFSIKFCGCDGRIGDIESEEVDADYRSVMEILKMDIGKIDIGIAIEFVAGFGDQNITYPYSRSICFEKSVFYSNANPKVYHSLKFTITDSEWIEPAK
jgi:hypothetical protein